MTDRPDFPFYAGRPMRLGGRDWLIPTIPHLIGEELFGILPFLAMLWAASPLVLLGVIGAGLVTGLVAAPLWWVILQPVLDPLAVPRITLTDGKRQVTFRAWFMFSRNSSTASASCPWPCEHYRFS